MRVNVINKTEFLNEYHFRSLCLLYFPQAKFPANDPSPYSADFTLERLPDGTLYASAFLHSPQGESFGESFEKDIVFTVPTDDESIAAAITGKAMLAAGKKLFGFVPPWGYLTGLRPVKRARYYLERGFGENRVTRLFTNDYDVSEEKTRLSIKTARKETEMLAGITPNHCGVYVSVPFCPTRCDYCSFVSYSNKKLFSLIPQYVERLCRDIESTGEIIRGTGFVPKAVYIGGGTPSFLSDGQLCDIFRAIEKNIPMSQVTEYSFEGGRPDTLTPQKLALIRTGGPDRISVNPQSTCQCVLDAIGRKHTVEQFFQSAEAALKCGFSTVNTDLIAGLPRDTRETFAKTLEDVMALGFENITVHTLSIKNASEIKNDAGVFDPVGELARSCVSYAGETLGAHGYAPYYLYRQKRTVGNGENTGFSLAGHESVYNVMMMEESSTVFACGAGAITKLVSPDGEKICRIAFPKYPYEYLEREENVGEDAIRRFFEKQR